MSRLDTLQHTLHDVLGARAAAVTVALDELTVEIGAADYLEAARLLRDADGLRFEQLIDLCGLDYSSWKDEPAGEASHFGRPNPGRRFAVVSHLLSVSLNQRVRIRVFAPDDDFPVVDSVTGIWASANWYEREAFDLYGIVFEGHTDLRRLLTDYGFIGHPFRKDFPLTGSVEMRYDPEQKRVIYQPVTIEPRENVPRIVREEAYGQGR